MNYTPAEVKELWDLFRTGKAYPSEVEILSRMKIFKHPHTEQDSEFLPELNPERISGMAPNGSPYWVETIEPPHWFLRYAGIYGDPDPVSIFAELRKERKIKAKPFRVKMSLRKKGIS